MKFKKFVLITWEDICSFNDWKNFDAAKKDNVAICYSTGFIIEKNKKKQEEIIRRFKVLYNFRSELVHGKKFKKQIYVGHLYDARVFARQVLLWFLNCLKEIVENADYKLESGNIPTRRDIHRFIDMAKIC